MIRAERNQRESQGCEDRQGRGDSGGVVHVAVEKLVPVVRSNGLTRKAQRKRSQDWSIHGLISTSKAPSGGY